MRSETQMFDLILSTARADSRIRAVIMNGSRANPNAPRDFFQDFDIVYLVTDVDSFKQQAGWLDRFGERMILQLPDDMTDPPPLNHPGYAYLIQLIDGNRIDLTLYPVDRLADMDDDSQTIALLDKDGILPAYPPASDLDYRPKPPTQKQFDDCCNEFWWVSPYVAKGLWRQELTYAKAMLDEHVREQLMKMLVWYVGAQTGFSQCPGKLGKYLERFLEPELWQLFLQTYSDADYEHIWQALFTMGELFRRVAIPVGQHFGFNYPQQDDERVSAHLRHVHTLPRNAEHMYEKVYKEF
jgi:aminoglycoside 6-adenylyltransferase